MLEKRYRAMRHCDEYITDLTAPEPLRKFLDRARMPAHGMLVKDEYPRLFATLEKKRVRVVMASQLGDVGVTTKLDSAHGYERRVYVEQLSDFSETP
jgi:hypothetical protein